MRMQKQFYDGQWFCKSRGNLNSKGATMSEMTYFLDEVVVTPSHAVAAEPDFEICD